MKKDTENNKIRVEEATETNRARQRTFHNLIFKGELSWTREVFLISILSFSICSLVFVLTYS
jgi:hypothetical protein